MTVKTNTIHEFIVPAEYAGVRLDFALAKLLPDYSRSQLKQWILNKYVTINDKLPIRPRDAVKKADFIRISVPITSESKEPLTQGNTIKLAIVYEDDDILVINKPPGLVVHPGAGNRSNTLTDALLLYASKLASLPRAGLVHRLDKDTSGLLVVAKTLKSQVSLTRALQRHSIQRKYLAIVNGVLISGGTIDAPIGRHKIKRTKMAVYEDLDNEGVHVRKAITHYRVIERFKAHTLIEVTLETGRTHQIRVHLSHLGYPIVGDAIYGGRNKLPKGASYDLINILMRWKRQALHAWQLNFTHPINKKPLSFTANAPEDMEQLINILRSQKI